MSVTIQSTFGSPLQQGQKPLQFGQGRRPGRPVDWSAREDETLCSAIADGKTFTEAASLVGTRSRDACIGRMHRIVAKLDAAA